MIYNFIDDFCKMKTTVYLYNEYIDKNDEKLIKKPLSRPLKKDYTFADILCSFRLNWLFKNNQYGNNLKQLTSLARTYPHGSIEYNDIKNKMPGYTWNGSVKIEEDYDEYEQDVIYKRTRRCDDNILLSGIVCIEFDDIETNKVADLTQEALKKFPHLIYAGRTLSNKLFCIHRADNNLNTNNYKRYFMELAVQYYNEIGIKCDTAVSDVSRIRYMCDQLGARANMQYCDFAPSEKVEVEFGKIFTLAGSGKIERASKYVPTADETIYEYDKDKGFYYGHNKQHLMKIGELIVPVPSITQIINTFLALNYSRDRIMSLWENELCYYNYNNESNDIKDCISLTRKFYIEGDEYKVGNDTYNFLCMFFPEIIGFNGFFLAKNEFLCDRFFDIVSNAIITHKRILIHGDTGIGKTYFINRLGERTNVIVVVPYVAHMENYKVFNQIEVKDIVEPINSGVIIWDRFVRLFNKGLISNQSTIIIDESHKLFLDQSYRQAAVDMNNIIPQLENHICYMSATPIKEIDVEKIYRFEKERNCVTLKHITIIPDAETQVINNSLLINAFLHMIYGNIKYYDHIFIASDYCAQKIYDRLYGRFDCQLIRASQKNSVEYIELMKSQLLKHKIIIGTCISYESLNFTNIGEKILTLTDMNENTTAQTLTQISGRVRYSKNVVCVLDLVKNISKTDYNSYAEYYDKLEEIKSKYQIYNKHKYIQDNAEILDKLQEWYYEHSDLNIIKNNLPSYIKWKDSDISATLISDKSPLNIQVKNYIIDYLTNHDEQLQNVSIDIAGQDDNTNIFFGDQNYIKIEEQGQSGLIIREKIHDEQYSYKKLCECVSYKKINNMITKTNTLPKGVNGEIYRIIDIIQMEDSKYNDYMNDLNDYLNTLSGVYYCALKREIDKNIKIKKKYNYCFNDNFDTMYNKVFDEYVKERAKIYNLKTNAALKECTITDEFKHPEKYNLTAGQQFESVTQLCDYTHKNRKTIAQWRSKGWIK